MTVQTAAGKQIDNGIQQQYNVASGLNLRQGDYDMNQHDAEISIRDVNRPNRKIFQEGWMYVSTPTGKEVPPYFAPYFTQSNPNPGISEISRVVATQIVILIDYKEVTATGTAMQQGKWRKGLDLLRKRANQEGFADKKVRLFFLDEPTILIQPPVTKKAYNATNPPKQIPEHQIPVGFTLRFDELRRHAVKTGSLCNNLPGAR